jgi:gamma-glutamyl-gamma-aminobutyraldehyde dehydrogenase
MEAHREELALLETLDTGKPIRHSLRDDIPGAARAIRWYAEALDKVYGEVAPTGKRAGDDRPRTDWRDRRGGAVELPAAAGLLEAWPGAGGGQQRDPQTLGKSPLTALRLAGLAKEAGLPDGVLNVISGFGHEAGRRWPCIPMLKSLPLPAPPAPASSC